MTIAEAIKADMVSPRVERDAWDLARELSQLASTSIVDMPRATPQQYYEAIQGLVVDGYLELIHGSKVRRKRVEVKPEPAQESKPIQGMLF